MSTHLSHHPHDVVLTQFSLYVHKGGLKPYLFYFISFTLRYASLVSSRPRSEVSGAQSVISEMSNLILEPLSGLSRGPSRVLLLVAAVIASLFTRDISNPGVLASRLRLQPCHFSGSL